MPPFLDSTLSQAGRRGIYSNIRLASTIYSPFTMQYVTHKVDKLNIFMMTGMAFWKRGEGILNKAYYCKLTVLMSSCLFIDRFGKILSM